MAPSHDLEVMALKPEPPRGSSNGSSAAANLCTGGPDVIRKEAWSFYGTISAVRPCWELEEPKGPKDGSLALARRFSYRGTSIIRNSDRLGPYRSTLPRALWQS